MDESPPSGGNVDDILAHWGKIGMKWGHRKESSVPVSTKIDPVKIHSVPGKRLATSGGANHPPSEDAKKAAAYKQQARKSSVDSLSNEQLRHLVTRVGLERQYSSINTITNDPKRNKGQKFINKVLIKEKDSLLSGKKGPLVMAIGAIFSATVLSKSKHRSMDPRGVVGRSFEVAKHRPPGT